MARPKKNNADYFSHDADASSDEKIIYLESLFGNDGYAFYFKMLEVLTRSDNFEIEISDMKRGVYAKKCNLNIDRFNEIFAVATNEEVNAFTCIDNIFYSVGLKNRLECVTKKRNSAKSAYNQNETKNGFLSQKQQKTGVSVTETTPKGGFLVSETTQSKVKESKVKESKVNETKIPPPEKYFFGFDFFRDDFKEIWEKEFLVIKRKKKGSTTDRALKANLTKIKKLSGGNYSTALKILERSVNAGWVDFYELNSQFSGNKNNKPKDVNAEWEQQLNEKPIQKPKSEMTAEELETQRLIDKFVSQT